MKPIYADGFKAYEENGQIYVCTIKQKRSKTPLNIVLSTGSVYFERVNNFRILSHSSGHVIIDTGIKKLIEIKVSKKMMHKLANIYHDTYDKKSC